MISDFVPCFIKECRRKRKVQKKFGLNGNRIYTTMIHPSAQLGNHIYIAKDVDIREGVKMGDYSYCSPETIVFSGTEIGRYCSIGYRVQIGCPEHPIHFLSTSPNIYRNERMKEYCPWPHNDMKKPVKIGNDVWIGSNAVILQGVSLGDGCIVAAGAVVTKDIPPFSICGGVPAKQIGVRFESSVQKKILDSLWWEHDIDWIQSFWESIEKSF